MKNFFSSLFSDNQPKADIQNERKQYDEDERIIDALYFGMSTADLELAKQQFLQNTLKEGHPIYEHFLGNFCFFNIRVDYYKNQLYKLIIDGSFEYPVKEQCTAISQIMQKVYGTPSTSDAFETDSITAGSSKLIDMWVLTDRTITISVAKSKSNMFSVELKFVHRKLSDAFKQDKDTNTERASETFFLPNSKPQIKPDTEGDRIRAEDVAPSGNTQQKPSPTATEKPEPFDKGWQVDDTTHIAIEARTAEDMLIPIAACNKYEKHVLDMIIYIRSLDRYSELQIVETLGVEGLRPYLDDLKKKTPWYTVRSAYKRGLQTVTEDYAKRDHRLSLYTFGF